jgi:hypothetical protein
MMFVLFRVADCDGCCGDDPKILGCSEDKGKLDAQLDVLIAPCLAEKKYEAEYRAWYESAREAILAYLRTQGQAIKFDRYRTLTESTETDFEILERISYSEVGRAYERPIFTYLKEFVDMDQLTTPLPFIEFPPVKVESPTYAKWQFKIQEAPLY